MNRCELKFEHEGKALQTGGDYKVLSLEGLGSLQYDVLLKENPQMDGAKAMGIRALTRQILLTIDTPKAQRDYFLRFFPHKTAGKLTATWNGVTRWIDYIVERNDALQANVHHDPSFSLQLVCPDPFFKDMNDYGKNIAESLPMIAFPFVWTRAYVPDIKTVGPFALLDNRGDIETGVIAEITAHGDVLNPKLRLGTGEYFLVNAHMARGDRLRINTNAGQKSVTLNAENALHRIDRQSDWLTLNKGQNTLEYGAEDGRSNMEVRVYYTPRYLGM